MLGEARVSDGCSQQTIGQFNRRCLASRTPFPTWHHDLQEEHSKNERGRSLTDFEECLLAKACVVQLY